MSGKISTGGVKKGRNEGTKVVTANRLDNGIVVYRASAGTWTDDIDTALPVEGADAIAALEAASRDEHVVVGPYLMDVEQQGARLVPVGRGQLRESIRFFGPTVHPEFGRYLDRQTAEAA